MDTMTPEQTAARIAELQRRAVEYLATGLSAGAGGYREKYNAWPTTDAQECLQLMQPNKSKGREIVDCIRLQPAHENDLAARIDAAIADADRNGREAARERILAGLKKIRDSLVKPTMANPYGEGRWVGINDCIEFIINGGAK